MMLRKGMAVAFLIMMVLSAGAAAQDAAPQDAYHRGNEAYRTGDYQGAVDAYRSVLDSGFTAPELEFNLANAYLKAGALGEAILHYRRALVMDPGYEDAQANLSFARRRTRDVQEDQATDRSLLARLGLSPAKAAWVLLASVSLFCLFGIARILLWPNHMAGTLVMGILSGLVLLSLVGVLYEVSSQGAIQEGVILAEELEVRSGPGQEFTVHFRLHEGSEVELVRESDGWQEIKLSDELQGWIPVSSVAAIQ